MGSKAISISQKARVFALLEEGVPVNHITNLTGLSFSTIYRIRQLACECGYNPVTNAVFQDEFFKDAPRTGRPKALNKQQTKDLLDLVRKDYHGREMSALDISYEFPVSACTVQQILCRNCFQKLKATWKPILSPAIKAA